MPTYGHLLTIGLAVLLLSCGPAPSSDGRSEAERGGGAVRLQIDFDRPRTEGAQRLFDVGDGWPDALVVESEPGVLLVVAGAEPSSKAASFPPNCAGAGDCPRALVQLPDDDRLDPGGADFEYGARVRLAPDEADVGSNLVQKGRYDTPGGQWKLQVDGAEARPSCVLQGEVNETRETVRLVANFGIADGQWHEVSCEIADDQLSIVVDDKVKTVEAEVGTVDNTADLRIGSSGPLPSDDQFHGVIDDVTFCVGACD